MMDGSGKKAVLIHYCKAVLKTAMLLPHSTMIFEVQGVAVPVLQN